MASNASVWESNFILIDSLDDSGLEAVSSMQTVASVFDDGSEEEIIFMLGELSRLSRTCPDGLADPILPSLCANIPRWEGELLVLAGRELRWLCINTRLTAASAKLMALCAVEVLISVDSFADACNRQVFNAYGDVLCKSLSVAKWTVEECSKIFAAVDDYAVSDVADERLLAVKVLRGLSNSDCPDGYVESSILPRLWKMLPDREVYITGNLIATLTNLVSYFSKQKFFERLWPKILRLWHSHGIDNGYAKSTAISAMAELLRDDDLGVFDETNEWKLAEFFQYVSYFAYRQTKEDISRFTESQYECFLTVANELPELMVHLSKFGAQNWQKEGLKAFISLASCKDGEVRAKCASSLPTVCCAYRGKSTSTLTRVAHGLCEDESLDVRRNFAVIFGKILPFLATHNSAGGFRRMLQGLLEDRRREVRIAILDQLGSTLKTLGGLKNSKLSDLRLGRLLEDFSRDGDWRTQEKLAEQLGSASKILSFQQREEVLPLIRRLFRYGSNRVRRTAGLCALKIIRTIRPAQERCELISSFVDEFSRKGCTLRISLVEILFGAVDIYSAYGFEQMFARHLFRLSRDPVSNVRLKMAMNLHRVAVPCHSLEEYKMVIYSLKNDREWDVRRAMDGFGERAATLIQRYRTHCKRDAKKLAFERWLYQDQFITEEHTEPEDNAEISEDRKGMKNGKHAISSALTKMRDLFTKSKRKLRDQVGSSMRWSDQQVSLNGEEGSADRTQRLPDRDLKWRGRDLHIESIEEASFSSGSFGEVTPQRFSSAESSLRTSVVTMGSHSMSDGGRLRRNPSARTGISEQPPSSHLSSTVSSGSVWSRKYFTE